MVGLGSEELSPEDAPLLLAALSARARRAGVSLTQPRPAPGLHHPESAETLGAFRPLLPEQEALWPWAAAEAERLALGALAEASRKTGARRPAL